MLQIHRPLCPNLTLRLTQISPDVEDKNFTSFVSSNNQSNSVVLFNQSNHSLQTGFTTKYRDVDENVIVDRMVHRGIGLLENSERVELKKHGSTSQFERAHLSHIISGLCGGSNKLESVNEGKETIANTDEVEVDSPVSPPYHIPAMEVDIMQKSLADELEEVQPINDENSHKVFLPSSREPKNLPNYAKYLKNQESKYFDNENGHICYHDNSTGVCKMCNSTCNTNNEIITEKCNFCDSAFGCDCRAKVINNVLSCCKDMAINNQNMETKHENSNQNTNEILQNIINLNTSPKNQTLKRISDKYSDGHLSCSNQDENKSRLNSVTLSQLSSEESGDNSGDEVFIPQCPTYSPRHKMSSKLSSAQHCDARKVVANANTVYLDLEVTHRGMHRFIPRHSDEIAIETGDPLHVNTEADDLWCEGINLRTGYEGIFPSMYATNLDFLEDDDFGSYRYLRVVMLSKALDGSGDDDEVRKFNLRLLGSVEVTHHKGNDVLMQAISKVATRHRMSNKTGLPPLCLLEVNEYGLRMIDKSKLGHESDNFSHFFALKNISFCGHHPRNQRYFAFITKHPNYQRFACHVLMGERSTQAVSEAVGWAFHRFYQEYMAFTHQTEDIYLE